MYLVSRLRPLALALVLLACGQLLAAATVTVSTGNDVVDGNVTSIAALIGAPGADGAISLREAVLAANADTTADTIVLPAGTYTLTLAGSNDDDALTGDLDVSAALTITGAGSATTIIQASATAGTGVDKIFSFHPFAKLTNGFPIALTGATLRFGRNLDTGTDNAFGGAFDFDGGTDGLGTLTVNDVVFDRNATTHGEGGAVALFDGGTVTISNSRFVGNVAATTNSAGAVHGGAIFIGWEAGLPMNYTFNNVIIDNNRISGTTTGSGGGVMSFADGPVAFHACTITNNDAGTGNSNGGGLAFFENGAITIDQGTIISNNSTGRFGGAVFSAGPTTITDTTISGNYAGESGGGLYSTADVMTVTNSRIVGNTAAIGAGGADRSTTSATSSVIASNNWWGSNSGAGVSCSGNVTCSPHLTMTASASPTSVFVGGTSTLTASITTNSTGATGFRVPDVTPVSFSATLGTMSPASATTSAGTATSTFTATSAGSATATATIDSQSVPVSITVTAPPADLTISKTHAGNFAQGQTGATYTLTVSNVGSGATSGTVTVTDTLPSGLTATAMSGAGWSCTLATLTCSRSDALAASSSYPAITLTVNVAKNAPASVTNTASVAVGAESDTSNNTAADPTTIIQLPDVTIAKSHTPPNFSQGQTGTTYTLAVSNVGSAATSGTVTVTDILPAGLTATAMSGTGWSCTLATLTCTRSDALAASSSYPAITLTVNVAKNAAASVTNTASVAVGAESDTSNNTASDPTTIIQLPDLTITKSHTGDFSQGQTGANYILTVSNVGSAATSATVTVTDTLPAGLTATAMTGTGWSCTLGTLTCTRSDALAAGSSYPAITLTVDVATNAGPSLTNAATVSTTGESDSSNNTASDPTTVIQLPDLTIAKSHSGNFTQAQTGAVYTLTVSNIGSGATSGTVTVTDTLPAGLTATAITGTGWSCTLATLTCTRSDALAAGGSYPAITLTVDVDPLAPASVTNTATVAGGNDKDTTNNSANDPTTIIQLPDLTITKSHVGDFRQGQTGASWTITVSNNGGSATSGTVTVTDTLPAGVTATAISGSGWSCTLGTLTCTRSDSLAAGASYPAIALTVDVDPVAAATIVNHVTVSGGGEAVTSNNTASDSVNVIQVANLVVAKSHVGNFYQGQVGATYTLTVSNAGSGPTDDSVTLTDLLPAGLTATSIGGTGWTCDLPSLTCTRADVLASGGSYPPVSLVVDVASDAATLVTNLAVVSGGGEAVTGDNQASDPTTVVSIAIAPETLSDPQVGIAYSATLTATGGTEPYTWSLSGGSLPPGLSVSADGSLTGVPTADGLFTFTVTAVDSTGGGEGGPYSGSREYSVTVAPPVIVISPATLPAARVGEAWSNTLSASGGTSPYTFSITAGAVPPGLTLSAAGVLEGTPLSAGSFDFTVTATDSSGGSGPFTGSSLLSITVSGATTSTSITANPAVFGTPAEVEVAVTSAFGTVSGSVSLSVDGGAPTSLPLDGSGRALFTLAGLTGGDHALVATFAAQGNFDASGATGTLTVTPAATATSIDAPSIVFGADGIVTVTVGSTAGIPTGDVSLTVDGGTATVQPLVSGSTTFTVPSPAAGDHALVALFTGSQNFASSSTTGTLHVDPAPTSIAIDAPAVPFGADATITVTVSSPAGTPGGSVTITVDGGAPLTSALTAGSASFTLSGLTTGDHSIAASYTANGNFDASSATTSLSVVRAATTLTVTPPAAAVAGETVPIAFTVAPVAPGAGSPSGTVTITSGPLSCSTDVSAGACNLTFLTAGTKTIDASYAGDGDFEPSASSSSLVVSPAATAITITSTTPTPSQQGGTVTVAFALSVVAPGSGSPTGTITVSDGTVSCTSPASAGSCTLALLSAGSHTLVATYGGDANYTSSTSAPFPHEVTNVAPVAAGDDYAVNAHTALTITAPGVLANDTDAGGDAMTAVAVGAPLYGTLTLQADGSFVYRPGVTSRSDSFTYRACDSHGLCSDPAVVTIAVRSAAPTAVVYGDGTICAGETVTIHADLTGSSPWTLTWSDGLVEEVTTSRVHRNVSPSASTVYTLTSISDRNSAGTASGSATVTVASVSAPVITGPSQISEGDQVELEASGEHDSYQWYLAGAPIAGATAKTLVVTILSEADFGPYTVVAAAGGCSSAPSAPFTLERTALLVIPVIGSADGAHGSRFRSSMHIFNPGNEPFRGLLEFHGDVLAKSKGSVDVPLGPGEKRFLADPLADAGLAGLGSADLTVVQGRIPFGVVHVYNDGGENGTTGMIEPLLATSDALRSGDRAILLAPSDPVATRLNLGVRSLEAGLALRFTLLDAGGNVLTVRERQWGANAFSHDAATQIFGVAMPDGGAIEIDVVTGSGFVYAASTDNATNDPNLQIATPLPAVGSADTVKILTVAGSTEGALGSRFRTALQLYNAGSEAAEVRVSFHPAGATATAGDPSALFAVRSRQTLAIEDLIEAIGADGVGTADVTAPADVVAVARVYNDGASGQTSMTEELLLRSAAAGAGKKLVLLAPHELQRTRFNIGIRTMESGARLRAIVRSAEGAEVKRIDLAYPPSYFFQSAAGDLLGIAFTGDESVTIEVLEGDVIAYGVWTDNITHDPSLHFGQQTN